MIIARERANRPSEFVTQRVRRSVDRCSFCAGNEYDTPDAIAVYPSPLARPWLPSDQRELGLTTPLGDDRATVTRTSATDPAWQVRVIPNKYPAVVDFVSDGTTGHELFQWQPGYGVHEVIIESPNHTTSFSELDDGQAFWSFLAYRDRLSCAARNPRLQYGLVFKNCRGAGGATLEHTHSQMLAAARIPTSIRQELNAAAEYRSRRGDCIFCSIWQHEATNAARIVTLTEQFVVFCPFASRFPYETWVLPRQHESHFQLAKVDGLAELSRLFQSIVRGLEKIIPQAPYNYWIHTSPFDTTGYDHYHWHIALIPRITMQAGFEWGTGCFVNPVAPEDAADALRKACG